MPSIEKKQILLIDDEELVLKSITKLLLKQGYGVIACRSGEEAVQKARNEPVDLIVCDVRMPRQTGTETIKKLREIFRSENRKTAPEILITGYADEIANQEVEMLQVADYLYKPFDLRDFLSCVERSLKD